MSKKDQPILSINSVSELHQLAQLPPPKHTLITLIDHAEQDFKPIDQLQKLTLNFYNISIKRSFKGQMRYGRRHYDFDKGTMTFSAPNQVIAVDEPEERNRDGWSLLFHADLIRNSPLGSMIKCYGFFSYDINEALHLSAAEDSLIEKLVQNIKNEYSSAVDAMSGDILVSYLRLLLDYCQRFYSRQFMTRKMATNDLVTRFECTLQERLLDNKLLILPTVNAIADTLHVSPGYLSDMLRTTTGQTAQQHIQQALIDRAKILLATTTLSISEIAYHLGFEHPQSFNKLFKSKIDVSPLKYRRSLN